MAVSPVTGCPRLSTPTTVPLTFVAGGTSTFAVVEPACTYGVRYGLNSCTVSSTCCPRTCWRIPASSGLPVRSTANVFSALVIGSREAYVTLETVPPSRSRRIRLLMMSLMPREGKVSSSRASPVTPPSCWKYPTPLVNRARLVSGRAAADSSAPTNAGESTAAAAASRASDVFLSVDIDHLLRVAERMSPLV